MRWKFTLLVGLAIGYVLGSKAGRERYEQIRTTAHDVAENPTVQSAAGVLQQQASDLIDTAKQQATDLISNHPKESSQ